MAIITPKSRVRTALNEVLGLLEAGDPVNSRVERECLDLKEEAGRRDSKGQIVAGRAQNEKAATDLAQEAACMANTPGGGALIVGVSDGGQLIGTNLHQEWLRRRIYELTDRRLTVEVQPVQIREHRLLAIVSPPALEPVRWKGKIFWRVGASCVETDLSTWHTQHLAELGYDESGQASTYSKKDISPAAMEFVRSELERAGDAKSESILESDDDQLLRRIGAMDHAEQLTQAAALLFVGRKQPALDYVYREYPGGDSLVRVNKSGCTLAVELKEVFVHLDARNPIRHVHGASAIGQTREIPELAAREAIVNGLAHRDWRSVEPTLIEHVGSTLKVTSPGGFFGSVTSSNILTHPSLSRNRALTQLLATLRLAEREGIGVDRMMAHMIRAGLEVPEIVETDGPMVRTTLLGGQVDSAWVRWLGLLEPASTGRDVNALLVLRHLFNARWIDASVAAPILQVGALEANGTLERLSGARCGSVALIKRVDGVPPTAKSVWALEPDAVARLHELDAEHGVHRPQPSRREVAESYAKARGRISSTELASILGVSASNVGAVLKSIANQGLLQASNASGRGQGFHYRWTEPDSQ